MIFPPHTFDQCDTSQWMKSESGATAMIRLTILLCAILFLSLKFVGEDRGQMRLGLIEGEREAALQSAKAKTVVAVAETAKAPARQATPTANADQGVVTIAFSPNQPLVAAKPTAPKILAPTVAQTKPVKPEGEVKFVSGRSVNVRGGPSTQDAVVGRLTRGEAVTVVWVEDNGWARVRVEGDGIDGFMSMDFLKDTAD